MTVEHLSPDVHLPPLEYVAAIAGVESRFIGRQAVVRDCALDSVGVKLTDLANGILGKRGIEHGIQSAESVIVDFRIMVKRRLELGIA